MRLGRRQVLGLSVASGLWLAAAASAAQTVASEAPAKSKPKADLLGRVNFTAGTSELSTDARAQLDDIIKKIPASDIDHRRVQLLGFAAGAQELVSATRRLSLDRALAVRRYLVDRKIAVERVDVRALGTMVMGDAPGDRVDIYLGVADVPSARSKSK